MKKRDPIAEYCYDWVRWCQTRRFYVAPPKSSTLARLQPSKVGREPNARNHADMTYFNMAVHTLADMPKWAEKAQSFMAHYCGDNDLVKQRVAKLGISTRTYYEHVAAFAKAAFNMAPLIKKNHEQHFGPAAA